MLTADLVRARSRAGKLHLQKLEGKTSDRALELAGSYIAIAKTCVGQRREEFELTCRAVKTQGWDRRLAAGLLKLITDRCQFEADSETDPRALREQVFSRAAAARQAAAPEAIFDRQQVLDAVAQEQQTTAEQLERQLFCDLRSAHRLLSFAALDPAQLVTNYRLAQGQAVLLRATKVVAEVHCKSPAAFRHLFRQLKFHRLLFSVDRQKDGSYRLEIDGPFSLFSSVTKYGLKLALALPAIRQCETWSLRAELLWGKERKRLSFELAGTADAPSPGRRPKARLADEARALLDKFDNDGPWSAKPSTEVLHLPGVGLCVPDLVFQRKDRDEKVYVEVLGFWSRPAVWARVELVNKGLAHRVLFAVSSRLRVSEAALDEDLPGALYVFKGVMQKSIVEAKLDALVDAPLR